MSNYIYYIDDRAIKLADLAAGLGDNQLAIRHYSMALEKLRRYQGDAMQPMMMAGDLIKRIERLKTMPFSSQGVLSFDTWKLTKSSFVKATQCEKYLYLDKHKKHEKTPFSEETKKLFTQGRRFEDKFREEEFPGGIDIKEAVGNFAYFNSYTRHLLNSNEKKVLYEATIIEDDVLVMCDVFLKDENGDIDVYEIKLNSTINEAIINDLAIQYYICKKRFGKRLRSFNLVLRVDNDSWSIHDKTKDLERKLLESKNKISAYRRVLEDQEPTIAMGPHCYSPYKCEFVEYCSKAESLRNDSPTEPRRKGTTNHD